MGYNYPVAEWCPSGRRSAIGNRVPGESRVVGSNPTYSAILLPMLDPTSTEVAQRDKVIEQVRLAVNAGERIMLPTGPAADPSDGPDIAMVRAGEEPNLHGGHVGPYRYQFEGEDDLLHVMVVRQDYDPLTPEEAQQVVRFLLPDAIPGLIWLKPGTISQHFYLGQLP